MYTVKEVQLPLALMRVGLKGMNGAFYGPRGYREINKENINIKEFSKLSLIIPSYFPMLEKVYDYNQSSNKQEHVWSYPDIKDKPYHVRYIGIADMDMDVKSVQKMDKALFNDEKAKDYANVGDVKKRWVNWLTSQTRLTIGIMREKSGVFDEVCKDTLAIAIAARVKGFDPIVFFSGCKGFRVLWSDPAAFYWVDESYDYGKAFVASEAFHYFETHLGIDPTTNIVKKLDASVYSRDKGIKPDLEKHPSSHLYPVLIPDLDQFNDTLFYDRSLQNNVDNARVLDQRLVDRICKYWLDLPKLCPAVVPVINPIFEYNQPALEFEPHSTTVSTNKENAKPVYEHKEYSSDQLKEFRASRVLDPLYEDALLNYVNNHSTKHYTSLNGLIKIKSVIGDPAESPLWLISLNEFMWCGLKPGFHSDASDIRFIINTKSQRIDQKCFSTLNGCGEKKSFPVWASTQCQALNEERKQQWREAQKKASVKDKKNAEKQKDRARKEYATGQTTINNSIPEQYKEMKKMVDEIKIIKTVPSVNRVLVRSSSPEVNKPVRSFSAVNLPSIKEYNNNNNDDFDLALMQIDTSNLTGTQSMPVFTREEKLAQTTQTIKQTIERLRVQNPDFTNHILYAELEKVLTPEFVKENKNSIKKIYQELITEMNNNPNSTKITYPDAKRAKKAEDVQDYVNAIKNGNTNSLNPTDLQSYKIYINHVGFWFREALSSIIQNRKKRGTFKDEQGVVIEFAINDVIKKQLELIEEGKKWVDLGVKSGVESEQDEHKKALLLRDQIKKGLRDKPIKKKPLEPFMINDLKYTHKKYGVMIHRARLFDEGARLEAKDYYDDQFNILTYKNVGVNLNIRPVVISLNANESILDKALSFVAKRIPDEWEDLKQKYLLYIVAFEPEDNLAQEWGYIKASDLIIDKKTSDEKKLDLKRRLIVKREFIKTGPPLKRLLAIQSKMMIQTSKNRSNDSDKIKQFLNCDYLKGIGSDNLHNLIDASFDNDPLYDRLSKTDIDPKFIAAMKSAGHEVPKPDFNEEDEQEQEESKTELISNDNNNDNNNNNYNPTNDDLDALDEMEDETTRAISDNSTSMDGQTNFDDFNSTISNNNNIKERKRIYKKINNDDGEAEYTGA